MNHAMSRHNLRLCWLLFLVLRSSVARYLQDIDGSYVGSTCFGSCVVGCCGMALLGCFLAVFGLMRCCSACPACSLASLVCPVPMSCAIVSSRSVYDPPDLVAGSSVCGFVCALWSCRCDYWVIGGYEIIIKIFFSLVAPSTAAPTSGCEPSCMDFAAFNMLRP